MSLAQYKKLFPNAFLVEDLSEEERPGEMWRENKVNLVAYERQRRGKPIFTREALEAIMKFIKREVDDDQRMEMTDETGRKWYSFNPRYEVRDWWNRDLNIYYQNYCELCPENRPAIPSPVQKILQEINTDLIQVDDEDFVPVAVCMDCGQPKSRPGWVPYLGPQLRWEKLFYQLKALWLKSRSCQLLRAQFRAAAKTNVKIDKLVCFGFGAIDVLDDDSGPDFRFWSPLQHFAAFTIAYTLRQAYREQDPDASVKIIFQDPGYGPSDAIFWKLAEYPDMEFVKDPEGFLAVDKNTLVMTAHLPHFVPAMQIIADLVEDGPAGFICDKMSIDPLQKMWCTRDRGSPKVVRLLRNGYVKSNFHHHAIEVDLLRKANGGSLQKGYWLWKVDCFLKPKPKPKPADSTENPWGLP